MAGHGRDDPEDADLSAGARTLNRTAVANVHWDAAKRIGFAVEGSRWWTSYLGLGISAVWRADTLAFLRF